MRTSIRFIQRRRPLNRFRQRTWMRWSRVVISVLVVSLFFLTYFYLNLGTPKQAYATTMSAVRSGDWTTASTWSLNRVPQSYDTLTVPAGIEVNVDVVTQEYQNMKINVYGTLHFEGGK